MILEKLSRVLSSWFPSRSPRPAITEALEAIEHCWDDTNVFILEAPTGYGKSCVSASLALCSLERGFKSIIAFPLMSLLEDQHSKFEKLGLSPHHLGKRYMHFPESKYLVRPITLTTVDTLSLTLFGIPPEDLEKVMKSWTGTSSGSLGHYLFSWGLVMLSDIILDEAHLLADSTKSLNFLVALIRIAIENDQKLLLMSATIPSGLEELLRRELRDQLSRVLFIKFESSGSEPEMSDVRIRRIYDSEFVESRLRKRYGIALQPLSQDQKLQWILDWISSRIDQYPRAIVVFNTVRDALEFYRILDEVDPQKLPQKLLLHSRFNHQDRKEKFELLERLKKSEKYIVVSTQVIEAGVDISSNLFVTEIAPANSLIQRLGRFLRYDHEHEGEVLVWYESDESGSLLKSESDGRPKYKGVYDWELTNTTLQELIRLKDQLNVHSPHGSGNIRGYKEFLNAVYPNPETFELSREDIEDFLRILMYLDSGSHRALEKFLELEGSFVRESLLVSTVPRGFLKSQQSPAQILENAVPLSFDTLCRIKPREELRVRSDEASMERWVVVEETDPKVFRYNPRYLLRYLARNSTLAFVVDLEYSSELGLIVPEGLWRS